MLHGLMVVNAFLKTNKFDDIYHTLRSAAEKENIRLEVLTNAEVVSQICCGSFSVNDFDFCLFWDKDVQLAQQLEQDGLRLFNCASAIRKCDDKALTWLSLRKNPEITLPETVLAPKTFSNIGYPNVDFLEAIAERFGFPVIVKECFGSFGQQVYLANDMEELESLTKKLQGVPILFQKPVLESMGRDVRINVVGDKVEASILRHSDNGDFRSNLTLGGSMENYTPTEAEAKLALSAVKALGLDFAGVDVLFGKEGPVLCEVNSNAHFKTTLECTGINMAEKIMHHINACMERDLP